MSESSRKNLFDIPLISLQAGENTFPIDLFVKAG